MSDSTKNTVYGGTAVLMAGVALVKLIGALYKIPLGNILSTAAFSDFNSAYYIYSLLLVISTGGLPVALSKMISEASALGRRGQIRKTFRLSMCAFLVLGTVSFCIMFFFPGPLSRMLNNERSYYSILALSPAIFFICPLSAFRGYFQGHSYMVPTAVSQIIEAVCKLVFGLALAILLVHRQTDESIAAGGAIVGVSIGCGLALLYMFLRYLRFRPDAGSQDTPERSGAILRTLARLAVPITLGVSISSIVTLIDTSLVYGRLQGAAGYSLDAARTLKGVYDQAVTIYNLPASLMVPITAALIPAISACLTRRDARGSRKIAESMMKTAFLICCPAGVGLTVLAQPIMTLLYPGSDHALGGWILSVLGIASISVCMTLVSNAVLQAYNLVRLPVITAVIGSVAKIVTNYYLVGNKSINIKGAPVGTLVCFTLIALLNLLFIRLIIPRAPRYSIVFFKPLLASLIMGAAARACYGLLCGPLGFGNAVSTLGAICVAGLVYLILVLALRILSRDDLSLMPKGDKIAKILRIPAENE